MRASFLWTITWVFLVTSPVFAAAEIGTVTSVGKDEFTIKSSLTNEVITFKIGAEAKQEKSILGGKPDELKPGVKVHLLFRKEGESYICTTFAVIPPPLGPCEIDFSPMLVGDSVPACSVQVRAGSEKAGKEFHGAINQSIIYSAPTKVVTVRDGIQGIFSRSGWKVRPVGDKKLIVLSYKDSTILGVTVKAEGLPPDHQPRVKSVTLPEKGGDMK